MATEVTCGNCHGRLLVEVLGVVVACPHCGVHLSIPAPAPVTPPRTQSSPPPVTPAPSQTDSQETVSEKSPLDSKVTSPPEHSAFDYLNEIQPASNVEPQLDRDTDVATQHGQNAPASESASPDPGEISFNFGADPFAPSPPATQAEDVAASIFGDGEDDHHSPHDEDHAGWHSAPNLFLNSTGDDVVQGDVPNGKTFTSPLMHSGPSGIFDATVLSAGYVEAGLNSGTPSDPTEVIPPNASANESAEMPSSEATLIDLSPEKDASTPESILDADATLVIPDAQTSAVFTFIPEPIAAPSELDLTEKLDVEPQSPSENSNSSETPVGQEQTSPEPTNHLTPSQMFAFDAPPESTADTVAQSSKLATSPEQAFTGESATSNVDTPQPKPATATAAPLLTEEQAAMRLKLVVGLLFLAVSYASAVTLALLYMILFGGGGTHALESLPDVKPKVVKGKTATSYYSPKNDVAPGHLLELGKSQRFGSVLVTPLKVTKASLKFQHHSGQQSAFVQSPTEPLLKLWLKFENVSKDQTFSPLDPTLVFKREVKNQGSVILANGFLGTDENRRLGKSLMYVYDMPLESEFRIVGHQLEHDVAPGETWQTYIPSEEKAVSLKGDLIWRVHFRKGYNPSSLRGVTTLIDVKFNSSDIKDESA